MLRTVDTFIELHAKHRDENIRKAMAGEKEIKDSDYVPELDPPVAVRCPYNTALLCALDGHHRIGAHKVLHALKQS